MLPGWYDRGQVRCSRRLVLVGLLLMLGLYAQAQPEPLRIMTFNIRYNNPGDGFNAWPHRKELAASMIRYHDADVVGLQEALYGQLEDLKTLLPAYEWVGVSRDDGSSDPDSPGEFAAILYRGDRLERLNGGTFWLSPTPEVVGSVGWDAALTRIATWCLFRDKRSGRRFCHINTHFDHRGEKAREESARLILRQLAAIAGNATPILLTGDFNCVPTDAPYRVLTGEQALQDALLISRQPHHGPQATWSGFSFPGQPGRRIDYIFVNDRVEVMRHATLSESWSGRFPSDHLPVLAEIQFLD